METSCRQTGTGNREERSLCTGLQAAWYTACSVTTVMSGSEFRVLGKMAQLVNCLIPACKNRHPHRKPVVPACAFISTCPGALGQRQEDP